MTKEYNFNVLYLFVHKRHKI